MDEQNIITTLNAFYTAISGNAGEQANLNKLKDLFCEGAVLTPYFIPDQNPYTTISYNVHGYIDKMEKFLKQYDFHEKGYNYKIDIYGNIANVYGEYSSEIVRGNETYMRKGINLVQLLYRNDTWKIVSMLWEHAGSDQYF